MVRVKIGDLLLEQGLIKKEQLERALAIQGQAGTPLGEILIQHGFVSEEILTRALARQFGLPYASRKNGLLVLSDKEKLVQLIPQEFSRSHNLAPLFVREESLGVAVSDPMDVITMDNLRILTGKNLMVYLAMRSEINASIDQLYGTATAGESLAELAKEAAQKQETVAVEAVVEERADLDKSVAEAGEARVVQLVNQMIRQAIEERASDIHIEPMEDLVNLRFRIDGVLHEKPPPAKTLSAPIISRVKILSKLNVAERRLPQDGSFVVRHKDQAVDIRVATCPTVHGEKVVLRILNKQAVELSIEKLGMEPKQQEDFLRAANYPHGLIFLTGPTGSGKTTTLYAILKHVQSPDINIMTIEDPVEFKIRGLNQVHVKPQIGLTFTSALRSFLRLDPDVILVGEVRDNETAELCIRAALTGHLVLSTLHTNDAISTVFRLKDLGIEPFLVSSTLVLIAAQRLIRVLCPHCKESYKPDKAYLESLGFPYTEPLYKAKGCPKCAQTGYMGQKAIYEVIPANDKLRSAIQSGESLIALKTVVKDIGVMPMKEAGFLKVQQGITSMEEFLSVIFIED